MIQFNEIAEKKDLTELLSSPAIKAIIPERLSPQDARGFWDNLFAGNVQSEAQEINEDDLWGEIFGRTEEEFQFDFEIFPLFKGNNPKVALTIVVFPALLNIYLNP